MKKLRNAFTIVELLVVIAIIGILMGVLISQWSGIRERSKTVKCVTNLKNLAAAVSSTAMEIGHYPYAQSAQYMYVASDYNDTGVRYGQHKGWISWLDNDTCWPSEGERSFTQCSFASTCEEKKLYAITNGAIWTAIGKNRNAYLCPAHSEACKKAGVRYPGWSYVMSARFGWESSPGKAAASETSYVTYGALNRADRVLLFAEIPALKLSSAEKQKYRVNTLPDVNLTGGDGDTAMDSCLTYKSCTGDGAKPETIGFNHTSGRNVTGHVAFADGHVETLVLPRNGDLQELTDWLCLGSDVVYAKGQYEQVKDSEVESTED